MDLIRASGPLLLGTTLIAGAWVPSHASAIGVKGRTNAFASIAARGGFTALAWGASTTDGVTDIYVAISRDSGRAFDAPTRVNQVPGQASLSGEQPPRIALVPRAGRHPAVVVIWTAKDPAGTRLLWTRSDDRGKSFAPAIPVPGSDAPGNRGWASIATNPDGSLVAVWLDHRDLSTGGARAMSMNHAEHQHGASGENTDGVARAQLSQLFFTRLRTRNSSRAIARGVCYCCKTAIATDPAGDVYAAWRHVYDGNIRDIAFSKSSDGGRTFSSSVRVSDDHWVLDGCPENGPALAVDRDKRIHIVWPTVVPGIAAHDPPTMALFHAMSDDGVHFTPRQQISNEGVPRHSQIALGRGGELIVVWEEQARGTRRIAVARGTIDVSGTARFVRQPIADDARGTYPAIATTDQGATVAWTSGPAGQTVLRVERLPY